MGIYKGYQNVERRREYNRNYTREYLRRRRDEYIGGAICLWCGSSEEIELHHLDPEQKEDHRIWAWPRDRLEAELAKCITVCKSCHMAYHYHKDQLPEAAQEFIAVQITQNLNALFG